MKILCYGLALLGLLSISTNSLATAADDSLRKYVLLDAEAREIILEPRPLTQYGANTGNASHFGVHLTAFPDSRGRLALIEGQWHGMLYHNDQIYQITNLADNADQLSYPDSSFRSRFSAKPLDTKQVTGGCGTVNFPGAIQPSANTKASTINYNSLCSHQVDGICLLADLTVIFDDAFADRFGAEYQSYAVAILEQLDFFFDEFFDIRFKHLRLGFGEGNLFTASQNINEVLADIEKKRADGSLTGIDPNPRSLFHFVSGRDYLNNSDGIIGLASFPSYNDNYPAGVNPVLCTSQAIGTSQVFGNNRNRVLMTSLVITHEIGHNFGFDHDGVQDSYAESCTEPANIMGAFIDGRESVFSSCSETALAPNINALSNIDSCFDFPIDLQIQSTDPNPVVLSVPTPVLFDYRIVQQSLPSFPTLIQLEGAITQGKGTFSHVTLSGNACALLEENQAYQCTFSSSSAILSLAVSINQTEDDLDLLTQLTMNSPNLHDITANNNQITQTIELVGLGVAPTRLTAISSSNSVNLRWRDRATNEVGYEVQRRENGADWQTLANMAPNTDNFQDNNLNSGTTYEYQVAAVFSDGSTEFSDPSEIITKSEATAVSSNKNSGSGGSLFWLELILCLALWLRLDNLITKQSG